MQQQVRSGAQLTGRITELEYSVSDRTSRLTDALEEVRSILQTLQATERQLLNATAKLEEMQEYKSETISLREEIAVLMSKFVSLQSEHQQLQDRLEITNKMLLLEDIATLPPPLRAEQSSDLLVPSTRSPTLRQSQTMDSDHGSM